MEKAHKQQNTHKLLWILESETQSIKWLVVNQIKDKIVETESQKLQRRINKHEKMAQTI